MKCLLPISLLALTPLLAGELPELSEKPWVGWFSAHESRSFHFGVGGDGRGSLIPLKSDGEQFTSALWIRIQPIIEEVQSNGRAYSKKVVEESWEALTEPGLEAERIAYRAMVEGGAKYEVSFQIDGSEVSCEGRILEAGELREKPIRLVFRLQIPDYFRFERGKDGFEKKFKRDRIELLMADGKKRKLDIFEEIDAEEINASAIESAQIEYDGFKGPRLEIESGAAGVFEFWNRKMQPLSMGFSLNWMAAPAGNPDANAGFRLEFK
ncbi:hypothetical protein [Haloferula sp.]|uniref:hypothetical protein n=1 Tax=Haloferula sp. TaxID=2497595 RepID=UPI003C728CE8